MSILKEQINHFNKLQTLIRQNEKQLEKEKKEINILNKTIFNRGSEINRLRYEAEKIEKEWKNQK